jgi:DNA-binding NarL/FixJ family response regulator
LKILSCDDHDLFRSGLRLVVEDVSEVTTLIEARSATELWQALAEHADLDLVLLDLGLPDCNGLETLARLRSEQPVLPVAIVSGEEDPDVMREVLDHGAAGFIPKGSTREILAQALRLVLAGGVYVPPDALTARPPARPSVRADDPRRERAEALTPRQREVLALIAKGLTNKEIAGVLGIALGTVKAHVAAGFDALDVTNRAEAVMAMVELGLVTDEGAEGA